MRSLAGQTLNHECSQTCCAHPPLPRRLSPHCFAGQYLLRWSVLPICHTHVLALLSHYFKSVTCVWPVIFSLQGRCFCLVWFATPQETPTKPDSKKPVGTGTLLSCDTWPRPRHTHPKIGAHPSGYTPDKQTDPNRHLPESVQGRPLPHPASWYTLQGRSYNFCIITLCAFPDMSRHGLVLPPPCIKVFVYYNCGLQAICPNPHATPTVGHGVRHPLPTICPIHRSLPPAAFLQSHVAMLQQLTHLHCHLVLPHHCLVAPRDSSP